MALNFFYNIIIIFNIVPKCLLCIIIPLIIIRIFMKLTIKDCSSKAKMYGKVVIITGANTGIGYETAKELAKRGARVIIACRNEKKGSTACQNIIEETGNTTVVYKQLDLSSLDSVRRFSHHILETEEALHVLINNAGITGHNDTYTRDNILETMQVNYFGPFLLTLLLLPLLKKSKTSRIINLASLLHHIGTVNLDRINVKGAYSGFLSYSNSKVCNVIFTEELARRLAGSGVVVNAVHPGIIATNIVAEMSLVSKVLFWLWTFSWGRSLNQGIQTVVYLAVSEECGTVSGEYFVDCSPRYKSWKVNKATAKKLWNFSECLVKYEHDNNQC